MKEANRHFLIAMVVGVVAGVLGIVVSPPQYPHPAAYLGAMFGYGAVPFLITYPLLRLWSRLKRKDKPPRGGIDA
jgi:hypothetical protein